MFSIALTVIFFNYISIDYSYVVYEGKFLSFLIIMKPQNNFIKQRCFVGLTENPAQLATESSVCHFEVLF